MKTASWMFDKELWLKLDKEQQGMVKDTLISLSALSNYERLFWIFPKKNSEKAVAENLKFIGIHAGEKRIGCGEFMLPSSFFAILQYEFMLGFIKDLDVQDSILQCARFGLRTVEKFRDFFDIPSFEREDDILIVEVFQKDGDKGFVCDFKKVDELDEEKWVIRRCMPSEPKSVGLEIHKSFGFVNSVGNTSNASKRIREIFGVQDGN